MYEASVALGAFFIAVPWRGTRTAASVSVLLTVVLFFAFYALDVRHTLGRWQRFGGDFQEVVVQGVYDTVRNEASIIPIREDAFLEVVMIQRYVAQHGLQGGRMLLRVPLFWVPRSFWPTKPTSPAWLASEMGPHPYANVSAPLWVEGYVDFGVLGALAYLAAWGWATAAVDRRLAQAATNPAGPVVADAAGAVFAASSFILLRGDLVAAMRPMVVALSTLAMARYVLLGSASRMRAADAAAVSECAPIAGR